MSEILIWALVSADQQRSLQEPAARSSVVFQVRRYVFNLFASKQSTEFAAPLCAEIPTGRIFRRIRPHSF
jgi:hypothetical protein